MVHIVFQMANAVAEKNSTQGHYWPRFDLFKFKGGRQFPNNWCIRSRILALICGIQIPASLLTWPKFLQSAANIIVIQCLQLFPLVMDTWITLSHQISCSIQCCLVCLKLEPLQSNYQVLARYIILNRCMLGVLVLFLTVVSPLWSTVH